MTRVHFLFSLGLAAALAIVAGCSKKDQPTPEQKPGPGPTPTFVRRPEPGSDAEKVAKAEAKKRLEQIGKAVHEFEAAHGHFPAGIIGPDGELGLSWRVQILPFLGEGELYQQFNLKEAWDSEHNKKLVAKMPKLFESTGQGSDPGETYIQSIHGDWAIIPPLYPSAKLPKGAQAPPVQRLAPGTFARGRRVTDITDGTSNTLMAAEGNQQVVWSKPEELAFFSYGGKLAVPPLCGPFEGGFHGLMCDGSVRFFPLSLGNKVLTALITVNRGEVISVPDDPAPGGKKTDGPATAVPDSLPDAAARKAAVANYQKIVKGLHAHDEVFGYLPVGVAAKGAVGLSWRVQVLPYIGEDQLFKEFKLAEPWDSDHNKKLIEKMPAVYASPGKAAEKGHTFVRTTLGPGGIIRGVPGKKGEIRYDVPPTFEPGRPLPGTRLVAGIPDGTSNTILFLEAADAVPWTKPDEIVLPTHLVAGASGPPKDAKLPAFGGAFADGFHATMADGRVTFYKSDYPAIELAKMLCPNDGWVIDPFGVPEKIAYSIWEAPPPNPKKGEIKTK